MDETSTEHAEGSSALYCAVAWSLALPCTVKRWLARRQLIVKHLSETCRIVLGQAGEEDMDVEQIDIRALERVSPRTALMAPEQVLHIGYLPQSIPVGVHMSVLDILNVATSRRLLKEPTVAWHPFPL